MQVGYFLLVVGIVMTNLVLLVRVPRRGLLFALTLVTFCNDSLPWELFSTKRIATLFELAVVLLCLVYLILIREDRVTALSNAVNLYTILTMVFLVQMIVFLPLSHSFSYGVFKIEVFAVQGILPLLAYVALSPFIDKDLQTVVWSMGLGAGLMTMKVLVTGSLVTVSLAHALVNPDVIAFGRYIGYGLTILVVAYFLGKIPGLWRNLLVLASMVVMTAAILLVGERGPVVGVLVSLGVTTVIAFNHYRTRVEYLYRFGLLAVLGALAVLGTNWMHLEAARSLRVLNFLSQIPTLGLSGSSAGRMERYAVAWHAFVQSHGLGIGTGDFAVYYGSAYYDYPHNLIMEILSEQGLIGIVLFVALMVVTVRQFWFLINAPEWTLSLRILFAVWVYDFFNAQVSGDIGANATMWTLGAVFWMLTRSAVAEPLGVEWSYARVQGGQLG